MAIEFIPTWRTCLDSIKDFPTVSSTFASVHAASLADRLNEIARGRFDMDVADRPAPLSVLGGDKVNLSTEAIFKSAGRAVITYLALTTLSSLSLCINGFVGVGKATLALLIGGVTQAGTEKYRDAQNLLEQGVFHIASAVADFAIGQMSLVAAAFAIFHGVAPRAAEKAVGDSFIWRGPIILADDAGNVAHAKNRENYSVWQNFADRVQRVVLPDAGASRLQAIFAPA